LNLSSQKNADKIFITNPILVFNARKVKMKKIYRKTEIPGLRIQLWRGKFDLKKCVRGSDFFFGSMEAGNIGICEIQAEKPN